MLSPYFTLGLLPAFLMAPISGVVSGQNYPSKPVRIVAGSAAGGGTDFSARIIAQELNVYLGQQVVVENQGGASGIIAAQIVAKAPPDGYTLLLYSSGMWIVPLMQSVPYDPARDFSPITLADRAPNILVLHPSVPAKSVKELIALAKAKPGSLNYATSGSGTSPHLAAELFNSMARVNIVRITYKSGAPAIIDLIAGQVQLMFATPGGVEPHINSGRLRAIAVTSAEPSSLLPSLPTVAASGVPDYEAGTAHAIFAPAGTPAAIINRLNNQIVRVLGQANVKERFLKAGIEPVGSSPEQLMATMKSEMARMGKVIKDAGIRAE